MKLIITSGFTTVVLLFLAAFQANAAVVGGYTFADDAFVNQLVSSNGSFLNYNSATSSNVISTSQLRADLTDNSAGTYVLSMSPNAYVDLAFGSTNVVNGAGNDLAFFFAGSATFSVNLSGQTQSFSTMDTGYTVRDSFGTYSLAVALVDLSGFGLAQNASLGTFRVMLNNSSPALSLVGSFNTQNTPNNPVPVPAPLILLFSGIAALGLVGRRK